jgi:glycerol-3-phosphate dehydrogenase
LVGQSDACPDDPQLAFSGILTGRGTNLCSVGRDDLCFSNDHLTESTPESNRSIPKSLPMHRSPHQALTDQVFDLAIIGGGILGAGIARDAAMRGLSVALIEKNDFASGTSSASTKLIHGGLRYLEQLAFLLVAESCRERSILLDTASHLVKPLPLLMPVYDGDQHSLFKLRLGTTVYDWMTLSRHRLMPRHETRTPGEAVALEPALPARGQDGSALKGAVVVYDCQMDDARLCIETVLDAEQRGAVCMNYCQVTGVRMQGHRVESVQVDDEINNQSFDVRAKAVVNASGPWAEQVCRFNRTAPGMRLSPTKGVHLVIPRMLQKHGIYFQSKGDGRMIFLLPWDDASLLGTTDTDFYQDPGEARAETEDVIYLLDQLNSIMPDADVSQRDIITSFAGVRALVRSDGQRPSRRSREAKIVQQGDNLLNVAGGKYTTFRAIADKTLLKVFRLLNKRPPQCETATTPLIDRRPAQSGAQLAASPAIFESDVIHACRAERAVTLADVMRRRTRLALSSSGGRPVAEAVTRTMAAELGWDATAQSNHLNEYLEVWDRSSQWSGKV